MLTICKNQTVHLVVCNVRKRGKAEYINHHKQYGQKLIWCERVLTFDEKKVM